MRWSMVWGGILIVLGALFLLDNLGVLPVHVWDLVWPLALIGLGTWTLLGVLGRRAARGVSVSDIPLQGAARARVRVQHGAGTLRVHAGAQAGSLASGSFAGGLASDARLEGDLLIVDLKPDFEASPFFAPWNWGRGGAYDWDLALTDSIPLDLTFETGAGEGRFDLSALQISRLSFKTGASSTDLTLPGHPLGTCPVRIEGGAASVNVQLPAGAEAFIRSESGLSGIQIDRARFLPVPGGHQTAGYAGAAHRLEIKVSMGVGSFKLS